MIIELIMKAVKKYNISKSKVKGDNSIVIQNLNTNEDGSDFNGN